MRLYNCQQFIDDNHNRRRRGEKEAKSDFMRACACVFIECKDKKEKRKR